MQISSMVVCDTSKDSIYVKAKTHLVGEHAFPLTDHITIYYGNNCWQSNMNEQNAVKGVSFVSSYILLLKFYCSGEESYFHSKPELC